MARAVLGMVTLAILTALPGCLDDRGPAAAGVPDAQAAEPTVAPPSDYAYSDQQISRRSIDRTWEWTVDAPSEAMAVHFSLLAGENGTYAGDFRYWFSGVTWSQSGGADSEGGISLQIGAGQNANTRFDYEGGARPGDYRLHVKAEGVEQAELCLCDYTIAIEVVY